jgi:hypothetical protein
MMEPVTETRDAISLSFFSLDASRRLHLRKAFGYAKDGAREIATSRARGYCFVTGDRVEEIAASARFRYANCPSPLIGMFKRERRQRV